MSFVFLNQWFSTPKKLRIDASNRVPCIKKAQRVALDMFLRSNKAYIEVGEGFVYLEKAQSDGSECSVEDATPSILHQKYMNVNGKTQNHTVNEN